MPTPPSKANPLQIAAMIGAALVACAVIAYSFLTGSTGSPF
jgi:hypothetical protein